ALGDRPRHDGGDEAHVDGHHQHEDPPQAGGHDLAVLGEERGAHQATCPGAVASASPTISRNSASRPASRRDSSWSSRPAAKAAAPTSAGVTSSSSSPAGAPGAPTGTAAPRETAQPRAAASAASPAVSGPATRTRGRASATSSARDDERTRRPLAMITTSSTV